VTKIIRIKENSVKRYDYFNPKYMIYYFLHHSQSSGDHNDPLNNLLNAYLGFNDSEIENKYNSMVVLGSKGRGEKTAKVMKSGDGSNKSDTDVAIYGNWVNLQDHINAIMAAARAYLVINYGNNIGFKEVDQDFDTYLDNILHFVEKGGDFRRQVPENTSEISPYVINLAKEFKKLPFYEDIRIIQGNMVHNDPIRRNDNQIPLTDAINDTEISMHSIMNTFGVANLQYNIGMGIQNGNSIDFNYKRLAKAPLYAITAYLAALESNIKDVDMINIPSSMEERVRYMCNHKDFFNQLGINENEFVTFMKRCIDLKGKPDVTREEFQKVFDNSHAIINYQKIAEKLLDINNFNAVVKNTKVAKNYNPKKGKYDNWVKMQLFGNETPMRYFRASQMLWRTDKDLAWKYLDKVYDILKLDTPDHSEGFITCSVKTANLALGLMGIFDNALPGQHGPGVDEIVQNIMIVKDKYRDKEFLKKYYGQFYLDSIAKA
jgi:hypothetical protein